MSERPTKERILNAAEALMLEKSFHSVGLNEILKAVQVPKGSFYHYFDSKEQFGVEMLRHYVADATAFKRDFLLSADAEPNPRLRLLSYLDLNIAKFLENNGKCPCLVVKLASEVASFSEPMRQVLADGHQEWSTIMTQLIEEAVEKAAITKLQDPRRTAQVIGCLWMGAMQHAIVSQNAQSLRAARSYVAEELIPNP